MSADIHAEYFFFKCKHRFLLVFSHIRKRDLKFFFLFVIYNIKERHLSGKRIFLVLCYLIHDLYINDHKLLSGPFQAVKCAGFDKVFYRTFIDFLTGKPFQKILQITKRAMLFSVPDDLLDHRSSNPLDRRKSVTDITVIYRKITNPTIDIRRQDRNSHLSASVNVFGNLSRIVNDRSHKCCHIFYRIIIFQIRCLV